MSASQSGVLRRKSTRPELERNAFAIAFLMQLLLAGKLGFAGLDGRIRPSLRDSWLVYTGTHVGVRLQDVLP